MRLLSLRPVGLGVAFVAVTTVQLSAAAAGNLVKNGDFELSSGTNSGIGHIGKGVTLNDWTKTCILQCGNGPITEANSHGFAFVVDDKAATRPNGGFLATINNSTEQLYFWGDDNTVSPSANGFAGSPNGGKFVAIDGDFGRSKLSQTVMGLDTSKTYTLSFEYAGAQQGLDANKFTGDTTQKWLVDGVTASQITVGPWTNPSKGFTPWQTYSTTFTPQFSSINLEFTAWGNVSGGGAPSGINSLPPFLLLDNVQILESTPPPNNPNTPNIPNIPNTPNTPNNPNVPVTPFSPPVTPAPGPVPLLGAGFAFAMSRRLRQRLKKQS